MSKSYHMEITQIIFGRLGGRRLMVMTGVRNLIAIPAPGLQFNIPKSAGAQHRVTRLHVILDPSDTYTVL
ncbi:hypothetical protein [Photobacterium leiognathi]|uniref:hypothetical protein n=1 Tax=Photobacterium leiognathi TaxID=553611 RepID=UPI00273844B7|nr:hypothetical protein [Photobacterium leiognathi]